jgi:hypothetical protein
MIRADLGQCKIPEKAPANSAVVICRRLFNFPAPMPQGAGHRSAHLAALIARQSANEVAQFIPNNRSLKEEPPK